MDHSLNFDLKKVLRPRVSCIVHSTFLAVSFSRSRQLFSQMYEYKFVRVSLDRGVLETRPDTDYRRMVEKWAGEGWRLVQIFSPSVTAHLGAGYDSYFELIFEREVG